MSLYTVCGLLCATIAELHHCDRIYDLQNWKYLLSDDLQKSMPNTDLKKKKKKRVNIPKNYQLY